MSFSVSEIMKWIGGGTPMRATTDPRSGIGAHQSPTLETIRIKRADANALMQQLELELINLLENRSHLSEQFVLAKQSGNELKTEILARSFMGVEQTIVLKKNLYGELAELEQMLGWDENRCAFDFIAQSFAIDLDQCQQTFEERIATHAVRRRKQYELAETVKEGEAALARMRDSGIDNALQTLNQFAREQAASLGVAAK
jgi:hypothetical protein